MHIREFGVGDKPIEELSDDCIAKIQHALKNECLWCGLPDSEVELAFNSIVFCRDDDVYIEWLAQHLLQQRGHDMRYAHNRPRE